MAPRNAKALILCHRLSCPFLFFLFFSRHIYSRAILIDLLPSTLTTMNKAHLNQATPETMGVSTADKYKPYIPLAGLVKDGWSKEGKASASCYCGAVQLVFVS